VEAEFRGTKGFPVIHFDIKPLVALAVQLGLEGNPRDLTGIHGLFEVGEGLTPESQKTKWKFCSNTVAEPSHLCTEPCHWVAQHCGKVWDIGRGGFPLQSGLGPEHASSPASHRNNADLAPTTIVFICSQGIGGTFGEMSQFANGKTVDVGDLECPYITHEFFCRGEGHTLSSR